MKKIIFMIVFLLSSMIGFSQWIQQFTGTTANLYDIEFLNINTGWCVGTGGTCLKTTNSGVNWIQMNHPVGTKPIESVHIVDSNVVYFVGDFETIFKTIDGGYNWVIIKNGPSNQGCSYYGLFFINKDSGWICGTGQKVLRTTNGGFTTDSIYSNISWYYDIYFKDANTGCISADGTVIKTTNGGINWYQTLNFGYSTIFKKISFIENKYGWIAGYNATPRIFRTTDFGDSWTLISNYVSGMYGVCFINKDTGFIGGMYSKLFKTTDGGYTWQRDIADIDNNTFESIRFVNDTVGWACGTEGIIIKTTTQGQIITNIINLTENRAKDFELKQNYPNPFNNQTRIKFSIPKNCQVEISVFNLQGKKVDDITDGIYSAGKYEILYKPDNLSSGIYFYRMNINNEKIYTRKLILLK